MCRLPFRVNEGGIDDVFGGVFLVGVFVAVGVFCVVFLVGLVLLFCFY